MSFSVHRLLSTGQWGDLRVGSSVDALRTQHGEPEDCGYFFKQRGVIECFMGKQLQISYLEGQVVLIALELDQVGEPRLELDIPGTAFGSAEAFLTWLASTNIEVTGIQESDEDRLICLANGVSVSASAAGVQSIQASDASG